MGMLVRSIQPQLLLYDIHEMTEKLHGHGTLETTVQVAVDTAAEVIPGVDCAGIYSASRDGLVRTRAASHDLVRELDAMQYELRDGPSVHAMRGRSPVLLADVRRERRWSSFVSRATKAGLRAQISVPLVDTDTSLGGLNLYSATSPLGQAAVSYATFFARQTVFVMCRSRREAEVSQALRDGHMIGKAIGIIMERYQLNEAQAASFVERASVTEHLTVEEISILIVQVADENGTTDTMTASPRRVVRRDAAP